jgi:DNA-binding NtrC family response regulator
MISSAETRVAERADRRTGVLLVESDTLLQWSIVETLAPADFRVTAVADARHAVMAVAETDYDVILVPDVLPDFDGLTLVKALRQLAPAARVIMLAGDANAELVDAALTEGVVNVLEKPVPLSDLAAAVTRAADGMLPGELSPDSVRRAARARYTHSRYGLLNNSGRR